MRLQEFEGSSVTLASKPGTGALQDAIFNSANSSSIVTDEKA